LCTTRTSEGGVPIFAVNVEREIQEADQRGAAIVQTSAVRRVDADRVACARKPRIGAALGAVAVQHVGLDFAGARGGMALRQDVTLPDMPAHRHAGEAK
jgi:hypothetical protein